jgi:ATP-binding protein involved in chromosome partitioning
MDGAAVGLVDLDIYGPSMPMMMGIKKRPGMKGQKLLPIENWGVKVMSIGFLVDPMQAVVWRGPMVSGAVKQFMSDVEWGELDYLVMDLPPGTGDIQLTLVQTIPLTGAVVVTTPQDISLADALKAWKMFEKVDVPVLGVVENMSYFVCSHCGEGEEGGGTDRGSIPRRGSTVHEHPRERGPGNAHSGGSEGAGAERDPPLRRQKRGRTGQHPQRGPGGRPGGRHTARDRLK